MELQINKSPNGVHNKELKVNDVRFIESNTQPVSLDEIREKHLVPVFVKDNTSTISQADFISSTMEVIEELSGKHTANLGIRVSHPIKGRIFSARNKRASELLDEEKTIYYERMAFSFDMPGYKEVVNGKEVTLSVIGVKAYNNDKLSGYGNGLQRFKIGIGQKVKVCTNMCLFTDGTSLEIKVRNLEDLEGEIATLVNETDFSAQTKALEKFDEYHLTQQQFATLLGKSRMYNHLPGKRKNDIPQLLVSDSQVSTVTRAYYNDNQFPKNEEGGISLWNLYNLYTGAVKSSYIDSFMDRNLNSFTFTQGLMKALDGEGAYQWFLS